MIDARRPSRVVLQLVDGDVGGGNIQPGIVQRVGHVRRVCVAESREFNAVESHLADSREYFREGFVDLTERVQLNCRSHHTFPCAGHGVSDCSSSDDVRLQSK
ncbi:hypothetical protein [Haladaptatus sp. R4]|uniref:hypothetical protein n=1 Tax=Haladaptatus sp. R4 TaxID=1679489 RepID=UPI001CC17478|nr:hypothetical protein [Haladaptatus sp. R4]